MRTAYIFCIESMANACPKSIPSMHYSPQMPRFPDQSRLPTMRPAAFWKPMSPSRALSPHTYVTTEGFLITFGLRSLRDLQDMEEGTGEGGRDPD